MVVLMGESSINGPFSMAMLNNQRVYAGLRRYTGDIVLMMELSWVSEKIIGDHTVEFQQ